MSAESPDGRLPLHLCQALEEEYVALHKQLPARGWNFEREDIVTPREKEPTPPGEQSPAAALLEQLARLWTEKNGRDGAPDAFSIQLVTCLKKNGDAKRLQDLPGVGGAGDASPEGRLAVVLNLVIDDPELYTEQATRYLPSPRLHEELVAAMPKSGHFEHDEDVRRFNRVLLEDAYPKTLKRIYQTRLDAIICQIHKQPRAALCLSGGGIRSGTFALGVLQGLAGYGLLPDFHYLSTVSGGGYIGSWFTAWCHRHPKGFVGVQEDLAHVRSSTLEPEAPPLRHLREYSNFVAPRLSLISADVWSFVAIYLRNLLINWSVLIPLLLSVVLVPKALVALLYLSSEGIRTTLMMPILFVVGLMLSGLAVLYITLNRPSRADALASRPFLLKLRGQGAMLCYSLLPTVLAGVCLSTFWGWYQEGSPPTITDSRYPVAHVFGWKIWFGLGLVGLGIALYVVIAFVAAWVVKKWLPTRGDVAAAFITGAGGGVLAWLLLRTVLEAPVPVRTGFPSNAALYVCLAVPAYLLIFFFGATVFVAATSRRSAPTRNTFLSIEDEDREWLARHGAWLLIAACAWLVLSALTLFGPLLVLQVPQLVAGVGGIAGLIALVGGRSAKTPASDDKAPKRRWTDIVLEHTVWIAAVIFIAALVIGLSLFGAWLLGWLVETLWPDRFDYQPPAIVVPPSLVLHGAPQQYFELVRQPFTVATRNGQLAILYYTPLWLVLGLIIGLSLWALRVAARRVNLNKFSLHSAYRERIIRAFLGASRPADDREPNPFTGFDPQDNVQMHELRPGLISEASFKPDQLVIFVKKLRDSQQSGIGRLASLKRLFQSAQTKPDAADLRGRDVEAASAGRRSDDPAGPNVDPYAALYRELSPVTHALLKNHTDLNPPSQTLKRALIEDLNRLIETRLLEIEPFRGRRPSARIVERLKLLWQGVDRDWEHLSSEDAAKLESNTEILKLLPAHGQADAAVLMKRAILDDVFKEELEPLGSPPPPWAKYRLMHIVGTALNLVGGKRLAWQQRRAQSFTVSPLHCGSLFAGYRRARNYGGPDGISLGTAVTISGAAVSSNMGYHSSSAPVTFVLTLLNARLGWWLGNPGPAGAATYQDAFPRSSIAPLRLEAFGLTDDTREYVLLSDGGHFDNLGLYEMVLRRCRLIVAVDGSQDGEAKFDDLGSTIRKIRIDLGINIEFIGPMQIFKRQAPNAGAAPQLDKGTYCAIAKIKYGDVDARAKKKKDVDDGAKDVDDAAKDGLLIYIKPAIYGGEPRDVLNYAAVNLDFPHQSTADQLFDEPQFESYRMLGLHAVRHICGSTEPANLPDLVDAVHGHLSSASLGPGFPDETEWLAKLKNKLGAP